MPNPEDIQNTDDKIKDLYDEVKAKENEKRKSDCRRDLESAISLNTISGYQDFVDRYKIYQDLRCYVDEAKNRKANLEDEEDWAKAEDSNTRKAYKTYIAKYKSQKSGYQGKHIDEAKSRVKNNVLRSISNTLLILIFGVGVLSLIYEKKPLTDEQIELILTQYTDSVRQDLFEGFYLAPIREDAISNNSELLFTREDVINKYMTNNGKYVLKNSKDEVVEIPEASEGIDSILLESNPFIEYFDENGLRRVVALFQDELYYYLGDCGSHDGFRQFILTNSQGKQGLMDENCKVKVDFVNEKLGISKSPAGYYVKNGTTVQNYNFLGNAIEPEVSQASQPIQPIITTPQPAKTISIQQQNGIAYLKDNFRGVICKFKDIHSYPVNGLYKVQGFDDKYGIYDSKKRQLALPTIYEDVSLYGSSTNMYPAKKDGKWGYVNYGGKKAINFEFEEAKSFDSETGLAVAKKDGKYGYIDIHGNKKSEFEYSWAETMTKYGAIVYSGVSQNRALVGPDGNRLTKFYKELGRRFYVGRVYVINDSLIGFSDDQQNLVIPFLFDIPTGNEPKPTFDELTHLCKVSYKGVEWYINTNGAFAYPANGKETDQNISQQILQAKEAADLQLKEEKVPNPKKRL